MRRLMIALLAISLLVGLFAGSVVHAMIIIRPADTGALEVQMDRTVFVLNTQTLAAALSGAGVTTMGQLAKSDPRNVGAQLAGLPVQSGGRVKALGKVSPAAVGKLTGMIRSSAGKMKGTEPITEASIRALLARGR